MFTSRPELKRRGYCQLYQFWYGPSKAPRYWGCCVSCIYKPHYKYWKQFCTSIHEVSRPTESESISLSFILYDLNINLQYIPRHLHRVFALLCFVVVIHWLIFPYPSGLLHWHCGNLTIAPVPAKQPWWIWINTSCEFTMNDCITTTKQSTKKPCAYFLRYSVLCADGSKSFTGTMEISGLKNTVEKQHATNQMYPPSLMSKWRQILIELNQLSIQIRVLAIFIIISLVLPPKFLFQKWKDPWLHMDHMGTLMKFGKCSFSCRWGLWRSGW